MTLTAYISRYGENNFEISCNSVIANCYLYGLGATLDEAKSDFLASVYDMQHFVCRTNHPKRRAASHLKINFVEC